MAALNNLLIIMKKKVDSRIQTSIHNAFKTQQRNLFVIVGDRARYQVVNFHYILAKQNLRSKPAVLWCYKKELGFSSHQKKRMKEVKNMQTKGLYDESVDDPFQLFIASTDIKYTFYKDSHRILGSTYALSYAGFRCWCSRTSRRSRPTSCAGPSRPWRAGASS